MQLDVSETGSGRRLASLWRQPLAHPVCEAMAVAVSTPLLLAVAFWNGFPLIFYDTGAYLLQGLGHKFLVERSPVYSLFLDYGGGGSSLWFIAVVQALATAFVIVETARCVAPRMSIGVFLGVVAGLIVLTGLPWYAGQIEPDCFTAITVLCVYLLTFHVRRLGWPRTLAILAIGAFAAGTHPSHLLLIAGLVLVASGFKILSIIHHNRPALAQCNIALPTLSALLGLCLIVASNHALTGKIFINRAGSVFVFASMLQDGLAERLLDDTCPASHYALCKYRGHLPATAERWLWFETSPFAKLGHFDGTADESQRVVMAIVARYPGAVLLSTLRDTAEQLVTFRTGDQIEPQEWVIYPALDRFIPRQMHAYMDARQQQGKIRFGVVNAFHVPVAILAQLALIVLLVLCVRRRRWNAAIFLGFILVALLGNAFICGALSNPRDRYQSRLIWLPFFAVALLGTERGFALRAQAESGT
jgi:hypothetical protein